MNSDFIFLSICSRNKCFIIRRTIKSFSPDKKGNLFHIKYILMRSFFYHKSIKRIRDNFFWTVDELFPPVVFLDIKIQFPYWSEPISTSCTVTDQPWPGSGIQQPPAQRWCWHSACYSRPRPPQPPATPEIIQSLKPLTSVTVCFTLVSSLYVSALALILKLKVRKVPWEKMVLYLASSLS